MQNKSNTRLHHEHSFHLKFMNLFSFLLSHVCEINSTFVCINILKREAKYHHEKQETLKKSRNICRCKCERESFFNLAMWCFKTLKCLILVIITSTDFADGIRKCKDENEVLSITTRNQVQDFYFKCPKPKHDLSQQSMKQKALESNWRSDPNQHQQSSPFTLHEALFPLFRSFNCLLSLNVKAKTYFNKCLVQN
ncbi:CLUMA_CG021466, isoform A [Clunio marinus]|uniref:CLUMA_CG021466, isoform A n=1 Tax=Clunio marinus TaxID=568069 RepID=A0A1J1J9L1_9DIPT|nr:CLUMA_CG021466, isoform A [Clunio marinus]